MPLKSPELSVNKLAEYVCSRGARQRRILYERKYPDPEFSAGMFHREAAEAVTKYFADGCVDATPITIRLAALGQLKPDKIGTARRINANIDALDRFADMLDDIDLQGAATSMGAHNPPKLTFHSVKISVRPEIILRAKGPKGQSMVGAVKLHFTKSHCHDGESAGYVSAVVQEYLRSHVIQGDEIVASHLCPVIDIGSGSVFPGAKAITKRLRDIEAECQNIQALWPSI
jgi:hypothetical protein